MNKPTSVFIATLKGFDWPKTKNYEACIADYKLMIDTLASHEVSEVYLQVKSNFGTLYLSKMEPTPTYFPKKAGHDLLIDLIEIAKSRNIKTIAWINPYRLGKENPDFISDSLKVKYDGLYYLNPSLQESRNYIGQIAKEVLEYPIDGLLIDDYFYPEKKNDIEFPDMKSFIQRAPSKYKKDINAWRRNNVSEMVKTLSELTRASGKLFYVSPRGIWRNIDQDPRGSKTHGSASYDILHADVLNWIKHDWIDVLIPQIYWSCDNNNARFDVLTDWWGKNKGKSKLIIALPSYKLSKVEKGNINLKQFAKMQNIAESNPAIDGLAYFRYNFLSLVENF